MGADIPDPVALGTGPREHGDKGGDPRDAGGPWTCLSLPSLWALRPW